MMLEQMLQDQQVQEREDMYRSAGEVTDDSDNPPPPPPPRAESPTFKLLREWEERMAELGYDAHAVIEVPADGARPAAGLAWLPYSPVGPWLLYWSSTCGVNDYVAVKTKAATAHQLLALRHLPDLYQACRRAVADRDALLEETRAHLATLEPARPADRPAGQR